LSEFSTEDTFSGPLSSTRRSLLEELDLGFGCASGEPPLWRGCTPDPPPMPFLAPWPRADPRGAALPPQPLASSTLLVARGDPREGDPNSPGSSPTVLLVPGHHGHLQDPPSDAQGSSPTVLLVPGDHAHPQNAPSDAQRSPGSSSTVLLVPGDHGHLQDPPSDTQGSNSTPGSPTTLPSPAARSTQRPGEQLKDEGQGWAPTGGLSPGAEPPTSPEDVLVQDGQVLPRCLSDQALRRRLRALGDDPGPITDLTRRLYLRRLEKLLVAALRTGRVPDCAQDEVVLAQQFDHPDRNRHWREGLVKSSFNYLLLDPRTTQNLPLRSRQLSPAECFRTFVEAIFYVGKGTRARPYCHLAEALSHHRAGEQKGCPKVRRILEIWASGQGVVSVHCFHSTVPAEAYTREGCLVEALGLQTITNQRKGNCYGVAASWPAARRRRLGVHLLHRAMRIFLAEGERQLRPADIQGGR
ncbi:ANKL1 protein, partial [Crotophaga sulcirostris]|nr:ANKL1 protein [Crotophaga sulcirostris]